MLASMMSIVRALNDAHCADGADLLTELLQAVFRADDKDKVRVCVGKLELRMECLNGICEKNARCLECCNRDVSESTCRCM
jgi:hypothetical protein